MSGKASFTFVEETGSTNADLATAIRSGDAPREGHWLVALRQNAGRGRQGREWFDGHGNFMGSSVVQLSGGDPPPATLAFATALAVEQAILALVGDFADVKLKWPNDVLLNGGKVSGILLELVGKRVIIGVGVNLAKAPELADRKTSALSDVVPAPSPESFAQSIAAHLQNSIKSWRTQTLESFLDAFLERSIHRIGAPIKVHDNGGEVAEGTFAGLEPSDGALRLRLADGSERVIRAGDIS